MTTMVGDLLEFARTQLGSVLPVNRHLADIKEICLSALGDAKAAHPGCTFELSASGELLDDFDAPRIQQVFSNLLSNAAQYCTKGCPVTICASGEKDAITVEVTNIGPVIPADSLKNIFNPWVRLHRQDGSPTSLGLGLFIAREITAAHGGTITVESTTNSGTVFTVRFPRAHPLSA
jgi:signal transduction histidine kinase